MSEKDKKDIKKEKETEIKKPLVDQVGESGEELEEFVPVEDQKLEAKLMEIATLKLNDDEQADDED